MALTMDAVRGDCGKCRKRMGKGECGEGHVYSGKIPSINKSAAKFLSTRVAVDNAALPFSHFPRFHPFPSARSFPSFPFPVLQVFPDSCWLCNIIALFLLTHAAVKKERKRRKAAAAGKAQNAKRQNQT